MTPRSHVIETAESWSVTRIEDLGRREFMFGAFAAALLIACGSDDEAASPTATPTRLVETPLGPVTVPFSPR